MINVSIRRGATPTLIIHMDTDIRDEVEITLTVKHVDSGIVPTSPNGTKFKLAVADDGALSTTAV